MADEIDIYKAAETIMRRHGVSAEDYARLQAYKYKEANNLNAASAWQIIADTIQKIKEYAPNETVH